VHAWVGLKNSDDQGTWFDLQVTLLKDDVQVAEGLTRCVTGVTRNPSAAKEVVIPWDPFSSFEVTGTSAFKVVLSTRIGTASDDTKCGGHNNAVGLRFYYDSTSRESGFDMTVDPDFDGDVYFHSDGGACTTTQSAGVTARWIDATEPVPGAVTKCRDSASLNFAGGNAWREIGTWSWVGLPND
jgi:hypothetical protein